tara:strand:+ start:65052 stop:65555 length:504 start_codon:yes stop_codon:yes gene_type:complete
VVKAFRGKGISLQSIRFAIIFAQDKFGVERPLSSLSFKTDGREILMSALERDGQLVSLQKGRAGQKVFTEIVQQSLDDLEYENGSVARWRPTISKGVVLDPRRSFGSPILDDFGISTEMLLSEMEQHNDISYLSKVYEIPRESIRQAIKFENDLDAKQIGEDGKSSL